MCPLRIILIFLSASLAAFLAWRSFSKDESLPDFNQQEMHEKDETASDNNSILAQGWNKVVLGFWNLVDMASGQYLWRNLVSNNKNVKAD